MYTVAQLTAVICYWADLCAVEPNGAQGTPLQIVKLDVQQAIGRMAAADPDATALLLPLLVGDLADAFVMAAAPTLARVLVNYL